MKTRPQTNDAMNHLAEQLEKHRVAMLTVAEPGTGLASRPMTPLEMDGHGDIWFMASKKSLGGWAGGPGREVNLAFVDAADGDFVSVAGHAVLVDDAARKRELWTVAARPWFSGPEDADLTLVRVEPQLAEIWDAPDSAVTRSLAMAASVAAGREIGLGHKQTVRPPAAR